MCWHPIPRICKSKFLINSHYTVAISYNEKTRADNTHYQLSLFLYSYMLLTLNNQPTFMPLSIISRSSARLSDSYRRSSSSIESSST